MANKYMLFGLSSFPTVCFLEQQKFSNAPLLQKFLVYKFHSNDTTYPFTWPSFCQRYRNISVIRQPLIYCPFTGLSEIEDLEWRSVTWKVIRAGAPRFPVQCGTFPTNSGIMNYQVLRHQYRVLLEVFEDILKDFSNTFSILSNLQKFLKIP